MIRYDNQQEPGTNSLSCWRLPQKAYFLAWTAIR